MSMTMTAIPGMTSQFIPAITGFPEGGYIPDPLDAILDAADEEVIIAGHVWLPARTGTKTISSAGGKIHWMAGAATITFADAGTTLRIGIQDPDTSNGPPVRGDGTDDVYAELVGGTDSITALTLHATAMESGTKDLTHGQQICISLRLTARGGSDLVRVRSARISGAGTSIPALSPTVILNTGSYATQSSVPVLAIEFDDGTFGFLVGAWITSTGAFNTAITYGSGSNPNDYCNILSYPVPIQIDSLYAIVRTSGASADFNLVLLTDPLGTPSVVEAVSVDANTVGITTAVRRIIVPLTTVRTITANTVFAIAVVPTSASTINAYEYDVANTDHWYFSAPGPNCYRGHRDTSGAYTGTTTKRLFAGVGICGLDDGSGGGGGGTGISRARAGSGMGS